MSSAVRAAVVLMLFGLAGCGPSEPTDPVSADSSETDEDASVPSPQALAAPDPVPEPLLFRRELLLESWQGDEKRSFVGDLEAGRFVRIDALQDRIDVELELIDPQGEVVAWVDTPVGASGRETLYVVTGESGPYELRIHAFGRGALDGEIVLHAEVPRPATAGDRALVDAARVAAQGERLRGLLGREPERATEALDTLARAAELWAVAGRPDEQGRMLMEMGAVQWRYQRDGKEAERLFAQAQERLAVDDASYRARLGHYRGEVAVSSGRLSEAREHYAGAVESWPGAQRTSLAHTLNNLGFVEHRLGRPQRALQSYERALEIWRASGAQSEEARALHNLGKVYLWLGDHERARVSLQDAARLWDGLDSKVQLGLTWSALGQAELGDKRYEAARSHFERALELHRKEGRRRFEGFSLVDLAVASRRAGQDEEAENLFLSSVEPLKETGSRRILGRVYTALARLHLARGETEEASRLAASAQQAFEGVEDSLDRAGSWALTAEVLAASGDPSAALPWIRRAVDAVETVRARPTDRSHRASFLARVIDVYESAVEVETARRDGAAGAVAALDWAERSKGRSFLDELAGGGNMIDPRPATWDGLAPLARDRVLLFYFLGDRASYLWRLHGDEVRMWTLAPRRELEGQVERLYGLLSERPKVELQARRRQELSRLGNALLPRDLLPKDLLPKDLPADIDTSGDSPAPRPLHIVADGALHYVPFAALPAPSPDGTHRPLIDTFDVLYAPSLTLLQRLEARHRERVDAAGPAATLVVADPVYDRDPRCPQDSGAAPVEAPVGLARLQGSAAEASWLAENLDGVQVLSGFEARPESLAPLSLERYRRLHFAVHGELGAGSGARPRLVLAQRDPSCRAAPSSLGMGEILQWSLESDLVVLGACKSGLGRDLRGEGLLGMTRAFLQAGSSRVLVTLWDVDDRSTARFMTYFYEQLETVGAAAALRYAQLRLRREEGDDAVFHWAPFVLFGVADDLSSASGGVAGRIGVGVADERAVLTAGRVRVDKRLHLPTATALTGNQAVGLPK